jgi:hypothetical protein
MFCIQAESPLLKVRKYSEPCKSESGVSEETLIKARNHEYPDDPKLEKQAFCILRKAGFIDTNGDFHVETMKTTLKENSDNPEEIDRLIAKCAVKKGSPEASSAKLFECFHKNRLQ